MFGKLFRRVSASMGARTFSGPADKRLYAVGDVHGRHDLLELLLGLVANDLADRPIGSAAIVFLGDLVDRGPDSAAVVERLRTLELRSCKAFFLLGNHEEMLLRVLAGEANVAHDWLGFGGDACAQSYGVRASQLKAMDEEQVAAMLKAAMPPEHVTFLKGFGDTFRFGDFLLVHAGIRPGVPVDEQQPHDLRWIRQPFLSDEHDHGCMVIHGHTVSDGVDQRANRIGIDTGAYQTGVLTAAVVEGSAIRFLATGSPAAQAVAANDDAG